MVRLVVLAFLHWLLGCVSVFSAVLYGSRTGAFIWSIGWAPLHAVALPVSAPLFMTAVSYVYSLLVVGTVMLLWRLARNEASQQP